MKFESLWLTAAISGATVTLTLARCRNCGQVKVASDPCSLDHLAALMQFKDACAKAGPDEQISTPN